MKIAILGGTRFIGLRTALAAHGRGHSVTVLKRLSPDVLIDTFAMGREQTAKTISALKAHVRRVVVLSSQDVYAQFGRLNGHPATPTETTVLESSHLTIPFPFRGLAEHEGGADYDKKNVEDEYRRACESTFDGVTALRLPAVFGTGDYKRRFGEIIDSIDSGIRKLPCQGAASWRWTQGHVENVAHAIVLASEKADRGFQIFNVGEKTTPTMRERVDKIANLMGTFVDWEEAEKLPDRYSWLGKMPNDFVVSTERIRDELGYVEPLPEDACYADLIDWCRKA
jgi:nucleoside-diphosphate-sugar epimerase